MDSEVTVTPAKGKASNFSRGKLEKSGSENLNPNFQSSRSKPAILHSPVICKSGNGDSPKRVDSSPGKRRIRQRRFVIVKKKKNGKDEGKERACEAYERLRAEQEEFFKRQKEESEFVENLCENSGGGSGSLKRSRDKVLEEARNCIPEPGSGRVMHLVQAFEKLRVVPSLDGSESKKGDNVNHVEEVIEWGLPGLHQVSDDSETRASTTLLCPSDFLLTRECLGLVSSRNSSLDSSHGSISVRTSTGQRNRASSTESSGTLIRKPWKHNKKRSTSQKPFMLKTEQRGRLKEEEYVKKLQKQMEEEEKMRIPIAQGLPWTTDEPERLVKPPTKETTKPIDLALNTDVRAVKRAEFDNQIAVKMSVIEQYRMERERQHKMEEEEEIRRLRKELIPKAQPMPYFDNPFVPRRSMKQSTIPKDPKFNLVQHKKIKCHASLCDLQAHID